MRGQLELTLRDPAAASTPFLNESENQKHKQTEPAMYSRKGTEQVHLGY